MRRFVVLLALTVLCGVAALLFGGNKVLSARPATAGPSSDCTITPIAFHVGGTGPLGASRPFSVTTGDLFTQFIAPVFTATSSSQGFVTVNDDLAGSVTGGITGTFTISNLNGLLVTNPEGLISTPRGTQFDHIVISDATGTITGVMAVDFAAVTSSPYPRTFNAYIHSTATSGAYAPYRFEGAITLGTMTLAGSTLTINGNALGVLYTGGGAINENILALRNLPPDRSTAFQPPDLIAQFRRPDLPVGAAVPGHVNPSASFTGTTTISDTGAFILNHNAMLLDSGANAGKGWLVGSFDFANTNGDIIIAPWLSDLTAGPVSTSLSGYLFKGIGTGVYTDSVLFASVDGNILGGTIFAGTMNGVYCSGAQLPTPTSTTTPPPAPTSTSTATAPPQPSSTAPPVPTQTALPPSSTPGATETSTPGTAPTGTPTPAPRATASPTVCPLQFGDVPEGSTFYPYVRCLACRGIISGYNDNTFRPNNNITRGQISKMVSNAANLDDPVPSTQQTYEDVASTNTFWLWIERLSGRGVMGGYPCGTNRYEPCVAPANRPYFRWQANATRAQLSKIVANAHGGYPPPAGQSFEDVPSSHPFYRWIEELAQAGVIGGYECGGPGEPCIPPGNRPYFRPYNNVTRGQASKIVANAFLPNCQTPTK